MSCLFSFSAVEVVPSAAVGEEVENLRFFVIESSVVCLQVGINSVKGRFVGVTGPVDERNMFRVESQSWNERTRGGRRGRWGEKPRGERDRECVEVISSDLRPRESVRV